MAPRHRTRTLSDGQLKWEELFDRYVRIPDEWRMRQAWNEELLAPADHDEIRAVLRAMKRHKAAGLDGLPTDFYKDHSEIIIPKMTTMCNKILAGAELPRSFAEGLIYPLRKKGDSANAMDYRPITLLQAGYKIFAKTIARRLATRLGSIIDAPQQGFIAIRHLEKAVLLMQATLSHCYEDAAESVDAAPPVLLLDIMKAYDCLNRDYMLLMLKKFGFDRRFLSLISRMHNGTTARFSVNDELSRTQRVRSGIHQGCPLAPLLFIIAIEGLTLMVTQDARLRGLQPAEGGGTVKVSAFVDDTAIFLRTGSEIKRVRQLLEVFEELSGLRAQPAKCVYIPLNKSVRQKKHLGFPVLQVVASTRYLGVQVGSTTTEQQTWEARIAALRMRLAVAAGSRLSVTVRVKILNVICSQRSCLQHSSAGSEATINKLVNLQKQFLWQSKLSTDGLRHKISPALLHTAVR